MRVSNDLKDMLARDNGVVEERCDDVIRERVAKKFRPADELAVLRKTVKFLLTVVAELHEGEIDTKKFDQYNEEIEKIIAQAKKEYSVCAELGKISDIMSEEKK